MEGVADYRRETKTSEGGVEKCTHSTTRQPKATSIPSPVLFAERTKVVFRSAKETDERVQPAMSTHLFN